MAAERRRRAAAEAEVRQLRAQLALLATREQVVDPSSAIRLDSVPAATQAPQEDQLPEHHQDLVRQVIEHSPNLVYVEDEAGQYVFANESYVRLLSRLTTSAGPAAFRIEAEVDPAGRLLAGFTFEECYELQNGQTAWYRTTKSPLVQPDGTYYLLSFSTDVTALKQAHQVAEESVQAKQLFMASVSHEIRTPLHGVMGLAELLSKQSLSTEQMDYVDMIQSTTTNLLVIINDILDFAKIESGTLAIESIPFDLLETVQEATRSLTYKMEEKGLLLRIRSQLESMPPVKGDPFRLRQIIINLLGNAIKFTPQGTITITLEATQEIDGVLVVTFSVADTGIGIRADHVEHIFNSFQQADNSISRLYGGTGLGLAICKNLVELQGGQIGVRSEPGQGSCFTFTIPYALSPQVLVKEPQLPYEPDLLRELTVLLVEDNPVNQLIAVALFGYWRVTFDIAQNGEEALSKTRQAKYDVILMDIQMPQLDGVGATAQLRASASLNQATPIVAVTADALRVNAASFQALGFTAFLTKPYTEAALFNVLTQVSQRAPPLAQPVVVPTPSASQELSYDFSQLGTKLAADPKFVRKILALFITRVPYQVQALEQALEQEAWEMMAFEAHSLKATFGNLHIQPTTACLRRLEELAYLQGPRREVESLLKAVKEASDHFCELFKEIVARYPIASDE